MPGSPSRPDGDDPGSDEPMAQARCCAASVWRAELQHHEVPRQHDVAFVAAGPCLSQEGRLVIGRPGRRKQVRQHELGQADRTSQLAD